MLSALAEEDYMITDPRDGDDYYGGRLLWKHPLTIKHLDDIIDLPY